MFSKPDLLYDYIQNEYEINNAGDIESALLDMFCGLIEKALEGEFDHHLGYERHQPQHKTSSNSRNGRNKKTLKTRLGRTTIETPRGRKGTFEPEIVPKRKTDVFGIEDKILALYTLLEKMKVPHTG